MMQCADSVICCQKISAKNAFGLHLIDYMSELFKKKEVTDFQVCWISFIQFVNTYGMC